MVSSRKVIKTFLILFWKVFVFNFITMYSYQLLLSRAFDKNHIIIFSYKVFAGITLLSTLVTNNQLVILDLLRL